MNNALMLSTSADILRNILIFAVCLNMHVWCMCHLILSGHLTQKNAAPVSDVINSFYAWPISFDIFLHNITSQQFDLSTVTYSAYVHIYDCA